VTGGKTEGTSWPGNGPRSHRRRRRRKRNRKRRTKFTD